MKTVDSLPVVSILPQFRSAVSTHNRIILSAAPGAGKTTVIPPETARLLAGKVRLIEPRRVAARAAACRIAELHGSAPGEFAGFSVRGESCRNAGTRLLAVTPGILIREFLDDPLLEGIDAIVFDEFHERSWECDFLLALALEIQESVRPELKIIIMSATLGVEQLRRFLPDAAVLEAPGREYPVEIIYRPSPCSADLSSIVKDTVRAVIEFFSSETGDMLVFLPGAGEIASAASLLSACLPETADIRQLHGALEFREQIRLLAPVSGDRRRIFLATNLAESSITIDGIRCVIDCGWEKRMSYSPANGMSFLEMQRISKASAVQRAGRAGRTAPGRAVRLFSPVEFEHLVPQRPPEISCCDLAPLALHIADWGSSCSGLHWLDPPPASGMENAFKLLCRLGAAEPDGRLTELGKSLNRIPLHPRLGSMLLRAEKSGEQATAAAVAALLEMRTGHRQGSADIRELLTDMVRNPGRWHACKEVMRQLHFLPGVRKGAICPESAGKLIACAYPEWIGMRRGDSVCYRLAGGRAGELDPDDPLRASAFIAVAALGGSSGRNARIYLAAPLEREELEEAYSGQFELACRVEFDPDSGKASAFEELKFDELVLESRPVSPPPGMLGNAVLEAALKRKIVLPPEHCKNAVQLIDRVRFALSSDPDSGLPDWSSGNWDEVIRQNTGHLLEQVRSLADLLKADWNSVFEYALTREQHALLDRLYPEFFVSPKGHKFRIDYAGGQPTVSLRVQELYGVRNHPVIGRNRIPLRLELLSPAQRPVQVTLDLPGFWSGSWNLVRKDMRGRYPKHDWPENPGETGV